MNVEQINRAKVLKKQFGWATAAMALIFFGILFWASQVSPHSAKGFFLSGTVMICFVFLVAFFCLWVHLHDLIKNGPPPRCPTCGQILPAKKQQLAKQ